MRALPPTRPTFLRSPAPAMPCTTTQKTIGATIIEMSFRKASLKNFRPVAKPGVIMPRTTPRMSATTTCTNSDLYKGDDFFGDGAGMSSMFMMSFLYWRNRGQNAHFYGAMRRQHRISPELPTEMQYACQQAAEAWGR